jgi:zinc transport system ATP-binding protein
MKPILEVKNLSFGYGSTEILSNLSFVVEKGDYIALAGPNGAGKTTLMKTVLNLTGKYQGEVILFGELSQEFSAWQKIGYLPQKTDLFNPLFPATAKEVVKLGLLSGKKFPRHFNAKDNKRALEVLSEMGIEELQNRPIMELSGGQQQRVFLARSLVSNPELLILDEPSTALDPQTREIFFDIIDKLNKKRKVAIILITHDTAHIGRHAEKLMYLDKKIVFYGKFSDFCQSEEMMEYFGPFSQHLICQQHS